MLCLRNVGGQVLGAAWTLGCVGLLVVGMSGGIVVAADAVKEDVAAKMVVDKVAGSVRIPAKIAPRKLPNLTEIYPIEVIASHPAPKGLKAHETVVTIETKPSEIHAALESLGLKAGKPAKGEGAVAVGPELKVSLEFVGVDGLPKVVAIEKALVDRKTGKSMPGLKWYFTGSIMKQLNPDKPEKSYAADAAGTLIAIFPVTDETVIQTNMTMKEEPLLKLETNKKVLPPEGTAAVLILEVKK